MQKDNPIYKEDPLTTLKETLVNAISTIDRLQCDNNPVLERYECKEVREFKKEENILQKGKEVLNSQTFEKFNWVLFTEDGFGFETWKLKDWRGDSKLNWDNTVKTFVTKIDGDEYILMNKPLLSLNDLKSVWSTNRG